MGCLYKGKPFLGHFQKNCPLNAHLTSYIQLLDQLLCQIICLCSGVLIKSHIWRHEQVNYPAGADPQRLGYVFANCLVHKFQLCQQ